MTFLKPLCIAIKGSSDSINDDQKFSNIHGTRMTKMSIM